MSAFIGPSYTPASSNVAVATSSTPVLAANPLARYRCFKNVGTNPMWLGLGVAAVVGAGICIEGRGTYEMYAGNSNMFPGAVNAIMETTASSVGLMEQSATA